MRPSGALALAALGFALMHPGKDLRVAFAVGLAAAGLAALGLALALFNIELRLGIDRWLAPSAAVPELGPALLRVAIAGTLGFGLAGGALALGRFETHRFAATMLASVAGAIAVFALLGYLAGIDTLYRSVSVNSPPLPTVAGLLCVAGGVLLRIGTMPVLRKSRPLWHKGDFDECQRQAEASLVLRKSGNIMLIDRNMQQLVNTWVPFGRSLPKTAAPEAVKRALATGKPQITGLFMSSIVKQLVVSIIVPVQVDGENRYVLARSPNEHALAGLVAANKVPPGWQARISDATHRIIARSGHEDTSTGKELPPAQWHRAEPGGIFEFIDSEGRPSLEAPVWSELTGWEIAVWAPKALLEAPVRSQWRTLGVIALLAIPLAVALSSCLGRNIPPSSAHAAH